MDAEAKSRVLELFTYGLYAVTVHGADGKVNGFTANWITQCSFEPPMVAVAVENDGVSIGMLRQSNEFAVNVLASGQRDLAGNLARRASKHPEKIQQVEHTLGSTGVPLLRDALGWVQCRVADSVPCGDHTMFIGEVVDAGVQREGRPLTIAESGFSYAG